jgi:hypothetical protein
VGYCVVLLIGEQSKFLAKNIFCWWKLALKEPKQGYAGSTMLKLFVMQIQEPKSCNASLQQIAKQ